MLSLKKIVDNCVALRGFETEFKEEDKRLSFFRRDVEWKLIAVFSLETFQMESIYTMDVEELMKVTQAAADLIEQVKVEREREDPTTNPNYVLMTKALTEHFGIEAHRLDNLLRGTTSKKKGRKTARHLTVAAAEDDDFYFHLSYDEETGDLTVELSLNEDEDEATLLCLTVDKENGPSCRFRNGIVTSLLFGPMMTHVEKFRSALAMLSSNWDYSL